MVEPRTSTRVRSTRYDWLRPSWLLTSAVVLALVPFIAKPFHIDDPLFVWIGRHIQSHPADPYGFSLNWYTYDLPVSFITKNPPLACYYLCLVGSLLGWSEAALHTGFLLSAIAAILGTYRLASGFCGRPIHAALVTLFTPVFLVSGTTVMCDVMMLAFWVWSLVFWREGTEQSKTWKLGVAVILIALASLTKYFGACLIPLVAAWSLAKRRPLKEWLGWLAIPVAVLVGYQFAARAMYGRSLLGDAVKYAMVNRESSVFGAISGLTFSGGCLAIAVFFSPFLWARRGLIVGTAVSALVVGMLCLIARKAFPSPLYGLEVAQILLWSAGGVSVLALAVVDVYRNRNADSLLLACWLGGTLFFATFCNWIINARSVLPAAVPAGILVMRRLEQRAKDGVTFSPNAFLIPTVAGTVLAVWVATGDYFYARASRTAAQRVCASYANKGHQLWFEGHWGFQYYMEQRGGAALDLKTLPLAVGDYVAVPADNSEIFPINGPMVQLETILVPMSAGVTTMSTPAGSGFYASLWGPLPFAISPGAEQLVAVFTYDPSVKRK